jgi:hypothetical protein
MDRTTPENIPHSLIPGVDPRARNDAEKHHDESLPTELWEPPFERWLRLADDLLRDWPGSASAREQRI